MKERPIIFSGESVRAILAGRKTQTRRLCKQAVVGWPTPVSEEETRRIYPGAAGFHCPHGAVGERLWVRECVTWSPDHYKCTYDADGAPCVIDNWKWKTNRLSPIFLPHVAARLHLEITDVRVQRLQAITEEDARCEGCDGHVGGYGPVSEVGLLAEPGYWHPRFYRAGFELAWSEVHDKLTKFGDSWKSNPWVWVLTFLRVNT